jgi:hypothetical protein
MQGAELLGIIFVIVRLAILGGLVFFAVAEIMKERRRR